MGWYGFGRLFLIPGRCFLPFERYVSGFPPDSVTLRCFLVFLQESLFAFFGFLLPFGLSWPFAFLRFSDLPLASSDYFAFFWVLLPFGLYFAVRVLRFSGLPLASSDYFGFFPGYSVIWSFCLPWIFQFLSRSRVASCWDPADSCELLWIPGLPSR